MAEDKGMETMIAQTSKEETEVVRGGIAETEVDAWKQGKKKCSLS